ncbi:MAG: tetratricopeptide repeat protein [Bacteroidia bacterium]
MRHFLLSLALLSCTHKIPEVEKIDKLESQVEDRSRFPSEADFLKKVLELTRAYEAFAQKYPNYPQSPEYLFKAAQNNASYFQDPKAAIAQLKLLEDRYRNRSPYAPQALFYRAFLYANSLEDTLNARKLYQEFLSLYPDHPLAKDAQAELQNLGQTPEQILQKLLQAQP